MIRQIRSEWADLPDNHMLKDPRLAVIALVILVGAVGAFLLMQTTMTGPVPWLGLLALLAGLQFLGMRHVRTKYGVTGPPASGFVLEPLDE